MAAVEGKAGFLHGLPRFCRQERDRAFQPFVRSRPITQGNVMEDGRTYSLRVWCGDGSDYAANFTVRRSAAITATNAEFQ